MLQVCIACATNETMFSLLLLRLSTAYHYLQRTTQAANETKLNYLALFSLPTAWVSEKYRLADKNISRFHDYSGLVKCQQKDITKSPVCQEKKKNGRG